MVRRKPAAGFAGRALAPLIYIVLALAVAAPLLGSGLVLAVDLNQTPHPGIPTSYWGLAEGTHEGSPARLPLDAMFAGLGAIDAVAAGQKLMLLAIIFVAGFGMHRLVPARTRAAAYFAGFLYAVNPFVYDRLYTGQWFLLLGYALLPHAYRAFLQTLEGKRYAPWIFGALFFATGIASTHFAVLLLFLCAITLVAWAGRIRQRPELGGMALLAIGLGLLPSLYWLIPTPGLQDFWNQIGTGQLDVYKSVGDQNWGLAATVAGLSGYWNDAAPIRSYLSVWPMLALALVMLAAWGTVIRRRDPTTWAVAAFGVFGFLLALGYASSVTRDTYVFLLDHVSVLRSFREGQKGVALLVFAYAFLGAAAVDDLVEHSPRVRFAPQVMAALLIALPLVFGYRVLGGLWGGLETSHYPASWQQANDRLESEASHSQTLFLPWHGYLSLGFADGRVVANPAPSYFKTPVLASRSVGEGLDAADTSDPVDQYVARLLARGDRTVNLSRCLASIGVTHVLLAKEADWERYRFLDRRRDLVAVQRWPDLVLYRSQAPAGLIMTGPAAHKPCGGRLEPLKFDKRSPVRYKLASTPPADSTLALGLPQSSKWQLEGRELKFERWNAYRRNYLLGLAGTLIFLVSAVLFWRRRPMAN